MELLKELLGYALGVALIVLLEAVDPPVWIVLKQLTGGAIGAGMVLWWYLHRTAADRKRIERTTVTVH